MNVPYDDEIVPFRTGIIGWPVAHSLSPAMHNAAFEALGLTYYEYHLLPVATPFIGDAIRGLRAFAFHGANITIPYKSLVIPYLDAVSSEVEVIGAVNTIVNERGRLLGYNTDAYGFWQALMDAGFSPTSNQAVVLGAGGAARGILYALLSKGFSVTLVNRTESKAVELARHFSEYFDQTVKVLSYNDTKHFQVHLDQADLLVNSTSVGMTHNSNESPLPRSVSLSSTLTVYDIVYNPRETQLLKSAKEAGAKTVDGLGMLLHQGAEAFRLWTHQEPPIAVMRAALEAAIEARTFPPP